MPLARPVYVGSRRAVTRVWPSLLVPTLHAQRGTTDIDKTLDDIPRIPLEISRDRGMYILLCIR